MPSDDWIRESQAIYEAELAPCCAGRGCSHCEDPGVPSWWCGSCDATSRCFDCAPH